MRFGGRPLPTQRGREGFSATLTPEGRASPLIRFSEGAVVGSLEAESASVSPPREVPMGPVGGLKDRRGNIFGIENLLCDLPADGALLPWWPVRQPRAQWDPHSAPWLFTRCWEGTVSLLLRWQRWCLAPPEVR
jgi:hypothetical protein